MELFAGITNQSRFPKFINCHLNLNLNLNLNFVAQNKSHWDCDWEAM